MLSYFNNKKQEYASLPVVVETPKEVKKEEEKPKKKLEPLDILLGEHPELLICRPKTHQIGRGAVFLYVTTREYLKYIVPLKQLWSERLDTCVLAILYCKVDFKHKAYIESLGYKIRYDAFWGVEEGRLDIIYTNDITLSHYELSVKILSLIHIGLTKPILPTHALLRWPVIPDWYPSFDRLDKKAIGEYLWMEK